MDGDYVDDRIHLYNGTLKLGTSAITDASPNHTYGKIEKISLYIYNPTPTAPTLDMIDNSVNNYINSNIVFENTDTKLYWNLDVNAIINSSTYGYTNSDYITITKLKIFYIIRLTK